MKSIYFPTETPPSAARLPDKLAEFLRSAAWVACRHPAAEGALLRAYATKEQLQNNLAKGESALRSLFAKAYRRISKSESFEGVGSAVPFLLSRKPKGGHYFLHVPPEADDDTPVLLLMHGYGGNLLYFPWAIWKAVPDCILIAPSWQTSWSDGPLSDRINYVNDALDDARKKTGLPLKKPWLVPLSQGGPMAFQLAAKSPRKFSGILGISTYAGDIENWTAFGPKFPIRLLHGDQDARLECNSARKTIRAIQKAGGNAKLTAIKGANHFLLLTHPEEVEEFLRDSLLSRWIVQFAFSNKP